MSQAGISDLPNRDDATPTELPAGSGDSAALPPAAEIPAVERFEQRIAPDRAPGTRQTERLPRLKEADWFSLARKLRQRNRDLLEKVAGLEQLLETAQESLQVEIARSRSFETLNTQQVRELEAARAKISWLYGELEASHQAARERSRNIEQLSQQLDAASDRIVALERECSLLQHHCQEQSCRVEIAEQLGRDLAARLECQQHRTLQFKAALDKCLERSSSEMLFGNETGVSARTEASAEPLTEDAPVKLLSLEETAETVSPLKTQPIQPWSARGEEQTECPLEESDEVTLVLNESAELSAPESDLQLAWESSEALPDRVPLTVPSVANFEPIEWEVEPNDSDTFDAIFETLDLGAELTVESEESAVTVGNFETLGETERLPTFALEPTFEAIAPPSSNFPAPIVYPHRREKKHRSLATIELPNFRH